MLLFNLVHRICSSYWPVVWWGSIDWQRLDYQRVLATPSLQYSGWSGSPCAHTPSSSTPVISSTHVLQERTWRLTSSQHTNNVLQGKCRLPCLKFLRYWAWQFGNCVTFGDVFLLLVIGCSVTLSDVWQSLFLLVNVTKPGMFTILRALRSPVHFLVFWYYL